MVSKLKTNAKVKKQPKTAGTKSASSKTNTTKKSTKSKLGVASAAKSAMKTKSKANPRSSAVTAQEIKFGSNAVKSVMSAYSLQVLKSIMLAAKIPSLQITSTQRTAEDQARAMYDNIKALGAKRQHELYGPFGDQVIDVYEKLHAQGKTPDEIKKGMVLKIKQLGPQKVSRHCADPKVVNVFDVAPSSISRRVQFVAAVVADQRVSKFLQPPMDPAYHLEILQPLS